MIFSLLILGHPVSTQSVQSALRFGRAAVAAGHDIQRVFFYHDAVSVADATRIDVPDDPSPTKSWAEFGREHDIELVVCVSSALKRGVVGEDEARRHHLQAPTLAPGFQIGGLGQLAEAAALSDRLVSFGP